MNDPKNRIIARLEFLNHSKFWGYDKNPPHLTNWINFNPDFCFGYDAYQNKLHIVYEPTYKKYNTFFEALHAAEILRDCYQYVLQTIHAVCIFFFFEPPHFHIYLKKLEAIK